MTIRFVILILASLMCFQAGAQSCADIFTLAETSMIEQDIPDLARKLGLSGDGTSMNIDMTAIAGDLSTKFENMKKTAEAARTAATRIHADRNVQTVMYPASGFDAATGFLLFPHARTVIGIDKHAFHLGVRTNVVVRAHDPNDPYRTHVSEVDYTADRGGLVSSIVVSLATAFPGLRLLEVREYKENNGDSHGIIDFDQGPGSVRRRYVHVDMIIPAASTETQFAKWNQVTRVPFEALMIKGAMYLYYSTNEGGRLVVNRIAENRGLVFDADNQVPAAYFEAANPFVHVENIVSGLGYEPYNTRVWYYPAP